MLFVQLSVFFMVKFNVVHGKDNAVHGKVIIFHGEFNVVHDKRACFA